jgi:hypothetical protein
MVISSVEWSPVWRRGRRRRRNIVTWWRYNLTREAVLCYSTTGKQHVTAGFRGNRYAQKKEEMLERAFSVEFALTLYSEYARGKLFSKSRGGGLEYFHRSLRIVGRDKNGTQSLDHPVPGDIITGIWPSRLEESRIRGSKIWPWVLRDST